MEEIIERLSYENLSELVDFYNLNWGSHSPLINIKQYMEYYFTDKIKLNFVVARDNSGGIISACGYIFANSSNTSDIWISLWLTKKGCSGSVGLKILQYITQNMSFRSVSSFNIRPKTAILYQYLGYGTAKLNHYYRLANKNEYKIAVINNKVITPVAHSHCSFKKLHTPQALLETFSFEKYHESIPYKDFDYCVKRYYHNPYYQYQVYGIFLENTCNSLIILRLAHTPVGNVLRIVDFIGQPKDLMYCGEMLQQCLEESESEYIDFYCYGLPVEVLEQAGFMLQNDDDPNIIPDRLEPIDKTNVDYYLFSTNLANITMFRADSDGDKLNIELI